MKKNDLMKLVPNLEKVSSVVERVTGDVHLDQIYKGSHGSVSIIAAKVGNGKSLYTMNEALKRVREGQNIILVSRELDINELEDLVYSFKLATEAEDDKEITLVPSSADINLNDVQELCKLLNESGEDFDKLFFDGIVLENLDSASEYLKGLKKLGKNISITIQLHSDD